MSEAVDKYGPEKQKNVHVMDLFRLDGRVALVTGGAGLYGSVISTALAEAGATVVIASRSLNKCEDRAAELRDSGYQAFAMPLDLSQDDSIIALKERMLAKYGRVDVLFNNAAGRVAGTADEIMERKFSMLQTSMGKMSRSQWEGAMAVNASGMFICTQVFAEQMVAQGHGGSIVNISSIYGMVGKTFPI
jgi:NAD(P)-dependent dehydrogenase (short-subunit alcohol dehydrogenase family)